MSRTRTTTRTPAVLLAVLIATLGILVWRAPRGGPSPAEEPEAAAAGRASEADPPGEGAYPLRKEPRPDLGGFPEPLPDERRPEAPPDSVGATAPGPSPFAM